MTSSSSRSVSEPRDRLTEGHDDLLVRMVDQLLSTEEGRDSRETAWEILQAGQALGELAEAAAIVGRRFAIRPQAVLEWYLRELERKADELESLGECDD